MAGATGSGSSGSAAPNSKPAKAEDDVRIRALTIKWSGVIVLGFLGLDAAAVICHSEYVQLIVSSTTNITVAALGFFAGRSRR